MTKNRLKGKTKIWSVLFGLLCSMTSMFATAEAVAAAPISGNAPAISIITGGKIWTGNTESAGQLWASTLVIKGNRLSLIHI